VRVFIQARLSSSRFPGKVLAPLAGKPVIAHVIDRVVHVVPIECITIATSDCAMDDPLASYAGQLGVSIVRGPLDDVFARFRQCVLEHPCDWFVRVCADSPLLDAPLLRRMVGMTDGTDADLVTNVHPRTFPKGQSIEILRTSTFMAIDHGALGAEDREHVTRSYYTRPAAFRIVNLECEGGSRANESLAVDTIEDLHRLENHLRGRASALRQPAGAQS
jgi:spore coat polysaccharide biosynthesis protein SpsF